MPSEEEKQAGLQRVAEGRGSNIKRVKEVNGGHGVKNIFWK